MKKLVLAVLVVGLFIISGCSSGYMTLSQDSIDQFNPIGIEIIASSQLYDNKDLMLRDFVIETGGTYLSSLFQEKGFQVIQLNSIISYEKVFKKYLGSFFIDEKIAAQYAKEQGCKTVLIVYYAYAIPNPVIVYPKELNIKLEEKSDINIYGNCSLYGFLVNANDAKILTNSHSMLSSFKKYLQIYKDEILNTDVTSVKDVYKEFIIKITELMFANKTI